MATAVSPTFSISVVPQPTPGQATWIAWEEFSYAYGGDEAIPGNPATSPGGAFGTWVPAGGLLPTFGAWQANAARIADPNQVARLITPVWGGFFIPVWDEEFPIIAVLPG